MLWFRVLFLYAFVVSMCLFSNAVGSVVVQSIWWSTICVKVTVL